MREMLLLAVAVMAASCSPPGAAAKRDRIEQAQDMVRANLRDPASAQFTDIKVHSSSADPEAIKIANVCGQVNAKNGFGGYAGAERFVVIMGGAFLEKEMGAQAGMLDAACR